MLCRLRKEAQALHKHHDWRPEAEGRDRGQQLLEWECRLPCTGLGSTSIVKLSSKPGLHLPWPLHPQHVVPGLGPWHDTGGLALTLHAVKPAAAVSNACLSSPWTLLVCLQACWPRQQ